MSEWFSLSLIFSAVTGACLLLLLLRRPKRTIFQPDGELEITDPQEGTKLLGDMFPMDGSKATAVQKELTQAGYYQAGSLTRFRALRTGLTLLPLLIGGTFLILLEERQDFMMALYITVALSVIGFAAPRLILQGQARDRVRRIEKALPSLVDSLTLCLSAGQNLSNSFAESRYPLQRQNPDLAEEANIIYRQSELRSLTFALEQFNQRLGSAEVANFCFILIQSEQMGSDALSALKELIANYRINSRQRAEAQANKVGFWMLIPTVSCLLVASALVLLGPGFVELINEGSKAIGAIKEAESRAKTATKLSTAEERMLQSAPNAPAKTKQSSLPGL
jgi:tight adherence protein C